MKLFTVFLLLVSGLDASAGAAEAKKEMIRLGLDEAKQFAVRNNYRIQALRSRLEAQKAEAQAVRSPLFPEIGIVGGMSAEAEGTYDDAVPVGYIYGTYNLFNGRARPA